MRIAVAYENGKVFQHFGHTEQFKVYDIEDAKIHLTSIMDTNGNGHGALAGILKEGGVTTLICGGIGDGAKRALDEAGIKLYGGVSGDADQAVKDLLSNSLEYNPDIACNHHGEHHHEGAHSCGGHGEYHCHNEASTKSK